MKFGGGAVVALLLLAGTAQGDDLHKNSREAALVRGSIVFNTYCVLCHGTTGKGDGRASKLHTPRPANLTLSALPDEYVQRIIRGGGESVGRSPAMPPWGNQLTDEQVGDLTEFLRAIRVNPR